MSASSSSRHICPSLYLSFNIVFQQAVPMLEVANPVSLPLIYCMQNNPLRWSIAQKLIYGSGGEVCSFCGELQSNTQTKLSSRVHTSPIESSMYALLYVNGCGPVTTSSNNCCSEWNLTGSLQNSATQKTVHPQLRFQREESQQKRSSIERMNAGAERASSYIRKRK